MTTGEESHPPARSSRAFVWMFLIGCTAGFATMLFFTAGCLRLGADAASVRDEAIALAPVDAQWDKQIEVRLGRFAIAGVRLIGGFIDLPHEADDCLGALRRLEVGVYRSLGPDSPNGMGRSHLLAGATNQLLARGWSRAVAVQNGGETVGVFVREDGDPENLSVCVLVLSGENLVLASGRMDAGRLVSLVAGKLRCAPGLLPGST